MEIEGENEAIKIAREDLYELVWSKPMRDLATDFGISDTALAKRCRRLAIPVPGRGYWARLDAGQTPYRPKLPMRQTGSRDHTALIVGPSADTPTIVNARSLATAIPGETKAPTADADVQQDNAWLRDRISFEQNPVNCLRVPDRPRIWHPTIQVCRDTLEANASELRESRRAAERHERLPKSRTHSQPNFEGWEWLWAKDRGQRIKDYHRPIPFRVSLSTYKRALAITNTLAIAARDRGFVLNEMKEAGRLVFSGFDADIRMRITEMLETKTRPHKAFDGKIEQESYKRPTGRLRITLEDKYREGPFFEDREDQPLDDQLNRVLVAMFRLVARTRQHAREQRARDRLHEAEQRRRAEEARQRAERERIHAEEMAKRRGLASEAQRWGKSQRIREYVNHIRTTAATHTTRPVDIDSWAQWALHVASDLDPTDVRLAGGSPKAPGATGSRGD